MYGYKDILSLFDSKQRMKIGLVAGFGFLVGVYALCLTFLSPLITPASAVFSLSSCVLPPSDLISWWPGDGDTSDIQDSNPGVAFNGASFVPSKVGQAISFDGVDDRITVADSDNLKLTDSLTIEGWVFATEFGSTHGQILFRGDNRVGLDPYYLSTQPDGNLRFHIESSTSLVNLDTPMPTGRWVHTAATLDGTTGAIRIYLDGSVATSSSTTVRPLRDLDLPSNPSLGIGNHGGYPTTTWNQPFNGQIDELSIYSRALSQGEIGAIFNADSAGKCKEVLPGPDVGLLAPVPKGTQISSVLHGYNDFPWTSANTYTCKIPSQTDHCRNQQFGLDLTPASGWNLQILAPAPGKITAKVSGAGGDCVNFLLDDNTNLNICHFKSVSAPLNTHVSRGKILGKSSQKDWIHLSLDKRPSKDCSGGWKLAAKQELAYYCPVQFTSPYVFESLQFPWDGSSRDQRFNNLFPITSTNVAIP